MKYLLYAGICLFFSFRGMAQQKPYAAFNHIAIYVKDLQRSVGFYSRLFKFDSIPDPFPQRKITWLKIGEHNHLHIIQSIRDTIAPQDIYHFCFSVDNINEFIAGLQQWNIPYTGPDMKTTTLTPGSDGKLQIWFKDPDGYLVEVNNDTY